MLTVQNNKWRNKEQLWAKIRKEVWTAKLPFDRIINREIRKQFWTKIRKEV